MLSVRVLLLLFLALEQERRLAGRGALDMVNNAERVGGVSK